MMANLTTTSTSKGPSSTNNIDKLDDKKITIPQINIDELAKGKVDEIEQYLNSKISFNLDDINSWLSILNQIITAADLHRTNDKNDNSPHHYKSKRQDHPYHQQQVDTEESIYADYADDNEQFNAVDLSEQFASNSVKWTIRVRAFKLVHQITSLFCNSSISSLNSRSKKTSLLKHLPELIRLSFVAATSPYDDLKIQGFEMFKFLIAKFAPIEEKEYPGHSVLEQYKTQVLSAIKPAFELDAPPYITAVASQVCCLWLCNGLEKDEIDLKRTYQLMMTTIDKLENQNINQNSKLYTESELEQERIDILGSWAQLFIVAKNITDNYYLQYKEKSPFDIKSPNHLNQLVKAQVNSLINKWWEALKDYALLIMPSNRIIDISHNNDHVYTRDVALRLFSNNWPKLLFASTIWLCSDLSKVEPNEIDDKIVNGNETSLPIATDNNNCDNNKLGKIKYFRFICGIIMRELCKYSQEANARKEIDTNVQGHIFAETTSVSIKSLFLLVNNEEFASYLSTEVAIAGEFYEILYDILKINAEEKTLSIMLKILLDNIFKITLNSKLLNSNLIKYGIAHTVVLLEFYINCIESAFNNNSARQDIDLFKLFLLLGCSNLINMIKYKPNIALEDDNLRAPIMNILEYILSKDRFVHRNTSYFNLLKDIHNYIPIKYSSLTFVNLFNAKSINVSELLNSIEFNSNEFEARDLAYLKVYLQYMILDIKSCDNENRYKLIRTYLELLINGIKKHQNILSNYDNENCSKKIRDLSVFLLKSVDDVKITYPDTFEDSLTTELREIYDSASKLENDIKERVNKTLSNAYDATKKSSITDGNKLNKKQTTKIVLKADFSNFYGKKKE